MFGWIKRRMLARRSRKSLDSVRSFKAARLDMARSIPVPPPASVDPMGANQAMLLSAVLDDDRRSVSCSSSFGSDSSSSWSGSDSSSSCSSSSSSSWD